MSEVNVQIQNPQQTVSINNPSIVIEIPTDSIEVEITEQALEIQVQNPVIEVNIGGPCNCSGGGHTIEDEGTPLTQRDTLNFVGDGVTVTDAGGKTVVTIPGGAGASDWGDIGGTLSDQTDLQTALDGKVDENAAIVGATKTKITYDSKGLVTAGDDVAIADITGLQTALDGKAASSHTHALSDLTQSGATLNQIPKWNGSAWVAADDETGGGGSVEIIDITYTDMGTALAGSTLTPGQFYRITDAAGTDLGFICQAIRENEITVNGQGGYLNADFQGVGDYGNTPETFNEQKGIWRTGFEAVTIPYTNLSGGTFAVGDEITGGNTGATAVIVTDNGSSEMIAYMTSPGTAFDGSEELDNGNGVTADMDGDAGSPEIVLGDVVIWNLLHYQLTDDTLLDGTDPATNTAAYTVLDKATYPETYVEAWDISEYDFSEDGIVYRSDALGNTYRGNSSTFQWGNQSWQENQVVGGGAELIVFDDGTLSNNSIYVGGYIGEITAGGSLSIEKNLMYSGSIYGIIAGDGLEMQFNDIRAEGVIGLGLVCGNGVQIYRNTVFGLLLSYCNLGDDVQIENNTILAGVEISNKTFAAGVEFSGNTIGVSMTETETIEENIIGKRAIPGFSDIPATIDITGLTTLDITAAKAQYCGIINVTSDNATEEIDQIDNPPTQFPSIIRPAAGLVLTITGTAYSGIAAGQIALKATDYVLDGDKGEYIVLEIDPLGSGCLVEKLVVNGLI